MLENISIPIPLPMKPDPNSAPELLRMKALAKAEAFRLRNGLDDPEDPARVAAIIESLQDLHRQKIDAAKALAARHRLARKTTPSTPAISPSIFLLDDFPSAGSRDSSYADKAYQLDLAAPSEAPNPIALQDLAFDTREQALWIELSSALGQLPRILDPQADGAWLDRAAAGQAALEMETSPEKLTNIRDRYEVSPKPQEDGSLVFETTALPEHQLAHLGAQRNTQPGLFGYDPSKTNSNANVLGLRFIEEEQRLSASRAEGMSLRLKSAAPLQDGKTPQFLTSVYFDRTDLGRLASASLERQLESYIEANTDRIVILSSLSPDSLVLDALQTRQWRDLSPDVQQARSLLSQHAKTAIESTKRINAEAASAWYERFAGPGAIELISKVYGRDIPIAAPLREIEFVASHATQLNQALEGQEALGLFSIRCAPVLGLDISGRALADSTKKTLREQHGLTDAGWRLLGKLPSGSESAAFKWPSLFETKPYVDRATALGGIPGGGARLRLPSFAADEASSAEREAQQARHLALERTLDAEARALHEANEASRQQAYLGAFCATLNASANRNLALPKAEEALQAIFGSKQAFHTLFIRGIFNPQAPAARIHAEEQARFERLAPIIEAFVERGAKTTPAKAADELSLIADWLSHAEFGSWQELPAKPAWTDLMAGQKQWHEFIQLQERGAAAERSWPALLPETTEPRFALRSVELTDGGQLCDEGVAMNHCVSSYAAKCKSGTTRIFSIQRDNKRLGTLELHLDENSRTWSNVQFRGPYNQKITDEHALALATRVAAECTASQAKLDAVSNTAKKEDDQPIEIREGVSVSRALAARLAARRDLPPGAEDFLGIPNRP